MQKATFAAGCFWGVEATFRKVEGVVETVVGYTGGETADPSYEEVCSGRTGHAEAVEVQFDPARVGYEELLEVFWDLHDPTTLNRQGPDVGTQYRSAIYTFDDEQAAAARASADDYQKALSAAGFSEITTEIRSAPAFYYAEPYHQQYLAKVPNGYCGLGGTGVGCNVAPLVKAV